MQYCENTMDITSKKYVRPKGQGQPGTQLKYKNISSNIVVVLKTRKFVKVKIVLYKWLEFNQASIINRKDQKVYNKVK